MRALISKVDLSTFPRSKIFPDGTRQGQEVVLPVHLGDSGEFENAQVWERRDERSDEGKILLYQELSDMKELLLASTDSDVSSDFHHLQSSGKFGQ